VNPVSVDPINLLWSAMSEGEFYSPRDLANTSEQPIDGVVRVLEFLVHYGFAEQVTKHEPIFRKLCNAPTPAEALSILQVLLPS
jgi:hypothetical protein